MNKPVVLAIGAFLTIVFSFVGLMAIPIYQFAEADLTEPVVIDNQGELVEYPFELSKQAELGRIVYQREGCVYCHSQQVRAEDFGADMSWGWGNRQSTPRDYIKQRPVLLGTMRTGPDLANIGFRQSDKAWHHVHMFDPWLTSNGRSIMPKYRYLYEVVESEPAGESYRISEDLAMKYYGKKNMWIVPSEDARNLIQYLLELNQPFTMAQVNPVKKADEAEGEEAADDQQESGE